MQASVCILFISIIRKMKMLFGILLFSYSAVAQLPQLPAAATAASPATEKIKIKWKMDHNKWMTGGLVLIAGASKGFNETLTFHWKLFRNKFPNARPQWFNPAISWRNKYEDRIPAKGARFPLSTSVLVMATDQYHLNNFINRAAWVTAIVIKIGEKKKPFKYYVKDILYHAACHQLGFALTYYPFTKSFSPKTVR